MALKRCYLCKTEKQPGDFYRGQNRCIPCSKKLAKKYYHQNKEQHRFVKIRSKYGINKNEWEELLTDSVEVCHACGEKATDRCLHIDHCHETGKVRGLLCHGCNIALGGVKDDPTKLEALVNYLSNSCVK